MDAGGVQPLMASYTFEVEVDVTGWPEGPDEYGRTEQDYAEAALYAAGLRESRMLDGFADIEDATAYITGTTRL